MYNIITSNHTQLDSQIIQGKVRRGQPFNGYAVVTFAQSNFHGKFKKGFTLGRCFLLMDNAISEIRGKFENDVLLVNTHVIQRCAIIIYLE